MTATSLRAFRIGLFEEHLEEASFLHSQCQALRLSVDKPWQYAAAFERRLELHLDALVVGGELALEVCRRRAAEGDPGELFAAASIFCRQQQSQLMAEVFRDLDITQEDRVEALAAAMKYELPSSWVSFMERALDQGDARFVRPLAAACGYRRIDCSAALLAAFARVTPPSTELIEALGKLRIPAAESPLKELLADAAPGTRSDALVALLRIGSRSPLLAHYLAAQQNDWPHLALGLGGDATACHALIPATGTGRASASALFAIGLLGMPSTLRYLYECLAVPELAEQAATAMNWITGANLYAETFVPAPVDETELFPKEIKAWRQYREAPKAADGRPFGVQQRKLSIEPDDWKRWFSVNLKHFDPNLRYRMGEPLSPVRIVSDIAAPLTDSTLRRLSALELAIRYHCDVPFETDMPVVTQLKALREMERWAHDNAARFVPGGWYFQGDLLQDAV